MKHTTIVVTVGLALAAAPTVSAQAQSARTFVSPTGNDGNKGCSMTAPCRTFQAAIRVTNSGGEITVLGTADYGTLTIDRAISIANGGGFEAAIMVPFNGFGITINAGANDAVSLRGLTLEGNGNASTGIQVNSAKSLTVDNCVIRHFWSTGISVFATTGNLLVSNSLVSNNAANGITVAGKGTGTVSAVLIRVQANNNASSGISVWGGDSNGMVKVTVNDSVASNNGDAGIFVSTQAGYAPTALMLFNSVAANNERGLVAVGGATIRIAHSTVTGNNLGWETTNGGVMQSYGDNSIDGNNTSENAPPGIAHK